jgi:ATP-dependent protease HslVU (ClpYQ) peptidase subunit
MTCIIGAKSGHGTILMAGDSAAVSVSCHSIMGRSDEKVFVKGPFVFGYTSSFRMGQLLRYKLTVPEQKKNQEDYEYMVTTFIDAVRECFTEGGYLKKENNKEQGGFFLVGYKGELYYVESDLQIGRPSTPYHATGSGADVALGAVHALWNNTDTNPEAILREALEASEEFNITVRRPFLIVEGAREDG